MKERIKKFVGLPLILLMFVIILALGIQSGELSAAKAALAKMKNGCILGCVLCMAGYIMVDAMGIHSALKRQGFYLPFKDTLMVSLRGQYYYYITPSASGGQPMQIYYLRELGVPAGVGTSVLVCHFAAFQSMLAVLMTIFFIPYYRFIRENIDPHLPLLVIGYIVNLGMVFLVLLLSFSRRPVRFLIGLSTRLAARFHLTRKPDALRERLQHTADLFHDSMDRMRQHPMEIVRQLFLGAVQQLLLMSVLYIIYRGLGLSKETPGHLIAMGLTQYITAAYVPIPGASGAQEGVFSLFCRQIFPGGNCFAAMLLWRFTTFYLPLVASAVSIFYYRIRKGDKPVIRKRK